MGARFHFLETWGEKAGVFLEESNPGIDARAVMHPVVVVVGNGPELRGELGSHGGCCWKGVVRSTYSYTVSRFLGGGSGDIRDANERCSSGKYKQVIVEEIQTGPCGWQP